MSDSPRFPVGYIHHATHLEQSPPFDGDADGARRLVSLGRRDARTFEVQEIQP